MTQTQNKMTPTQVAQIFENVFKNKLCVKPSVVGFNKNTYSDIGMDSLDGLDIIMELEKQYDIEISDSESSLLMGACTLANYLNTFVNALVANKRLRVKDALVVKMRYADLLNPKTPGNNAKSNQQSALDKYKKAVACKREATKKIKQHQK